MTPKPLIWLFAVATVSGCVQGDSPFYQPPAFTEPQIERDAEGQCFGRDVAPAQIQTITEQVMVQPAQIASDGSVLSPAIFRTVTRQAIVSERREVLFETLCPEAMTTAFIASLQRALLTRGYYTGPISGEMDEQTGRALQAYQRQNGAHNSPLLDIRTARELGLVRLSQAEIDAL